MKKIYTRPESVSTEIFVEGSILAVSMKVDKNEKIDGDVRSQHMKSGSSIWGE